MTAQPRVVFTHRLAEQGHRIDPLNALHDAIVFSSADWGAARDLAFIYGIVVGWDIDPDDDPEHDGDAMTELAQKFGWSETGVQRLRAMHEVFSTLRATAERPADAPTCQDTPDTPQPATEAHSAADTHDLIERAAHLARLGWAVEKLKNQGAVEFTLTQIEDAAREAGETK